MTLTQWLCENQILASIILTIITLGLGFVAIIIMGMIMTKAQELGEKRQAEKEAKKSTATRIDEIIKNIAKKQKYKKIMEYIFLIFILGFTASIIYTDGWIKAIPMIGALLFLASSIVIPWAEKKNKKILVILMKIFLWTVLAVVLLGSIVLVHCLYDWWVLHICHTNSLMG